MGKLKAHKWPAAPAAPPAPPAAKPADKRPWRTNMRQKDGPSGLHRPVEEAEDHGWAPLGSLEVVAAPGMGGEGGTVGRYNSPGPTRVRQLDPAGQADLVLFMERRRAETEARERQRVEAASAPLHTKLRVLREEMERTRKVGMLHRDGPTLCCCHSSSRVNALCRMHESTRFGSPLHPHGPALHGPPPQRPCCSRNLSARPPHTGGQALIHA